MSHSLAGLGPRRKLLGFKATDVAARVGMTLNGYGRIERGERRIYFDKALAISAFTGIKLEDLPRVPDDLERVELFKAGEHRRSLLDASQGDEQLASQLEGWSDGE
jgi:transcriptional regulator with XRE-family HTH domain